jgi:signal peptidase I
MTGGRKAIIITASVLAVIVAAIVVIRTFVFEILIVKGQSMKNTIKPGDHVVLNKQAYRSREPKRGELVAFKLDPHRILIKRVIGIPGDLIEVKNGVPYRNGERMADEPYVIFHSADQKRNSHRPCTVQHRHLFVMGDNRAMSVDSKDYGPITYEEVIGKVSFIYYPPRRMRRFP